jgi:hypothetical protein
MKKEKTMEDSKKILIEELIEGTKKSIQKTTKQITS